MVEKYFLMPGCTIGKEGLPGKKLECGKSAKPKLIDDKHVEIIKKNLGFYMSKGTIKTAAELEAAEAKSEAGKSEKRAALEAEAEELGIEFTDRTSGKDLQTAIDEAKTEVFKMANELEIEVTDKMTAKEVQALIDKKLEENK